MTLMQVLEGEVYEQSLAFGFVMSLMTGLADSEASVVGCAVLWRFVGVVLDQQAWVFEAWPSAWSATGRISFWAVSNDSLKSCLHLEHVQLVKANLTGE